MKDMELKNFNLDEYTDIHKSMFIEASAGTGKTHNITGIIKKLTDNGIKLEEILVVTYTEKAAGELRDRIRQNCPKKDVDNAPIFTIHSFCQKTLSEFYFTANQCANLSLVDDTEIEDFIDLKIRDKLKDLPEFKEFFTEKQETFINNLKRDLKAAVSKYYLGENNQEVSSIVSLDTEHFINWKNREISLTEFNKLTSSPEIEDFFFIPDFEENWNYLEANLQSTRAEAFRDDILANLRDNHAFTFSGSKFQEGRFDIEMKPTFNFFKNIKDEYKNLKGEAASYKLCLFYITQVKELYNAWQQEKAKNKSQSYNDMLRNVREALYLPDSKLKKQLQKKYRYTIIDEFQDTNQIQWDIFQSIFMEDNNHTIIVVGDPKQSIYSFEGADVNVYKKAIATIADKGGGAYRLPMNFRSTNPVVEACNIIFEDKENPILHYFTPNSNIEFSDSQASDTKRTAEYCNSITKPIWIAGKPDKLISEQDFAKITVQTIVDCCTYVNGKTKLQVFDENKKDEHGKYTFLRNVSFRDFAILLRSATEFPEFENALKEAGIPFLRYKDKNLFAGKECTQWISLFNAIVAEDFTGSKRSILSDALFTDFFCIPIDKVDDEAFDNPSCPQRQLILQWKNLAKNRKWANLLERIFADTDIENKLSNLNQLQTLSKIRQIGNYAINYLYQKDCSLEDATRHLTRLAGFSASSEDEGNLVEKGTEFNCVQIMSIHASKGLEFPVVIVPAGLKARMPDYQIAQAFLFHDKDSKAYLGFSKHNKELSFTEEDYERERIYYVAYTRACSLLILPYYDIWNKDVSEQKAALHHFLYNNIGYLFKEQNKKYIHKLELNNKISFKDLKDEVQNIINRKTEDTISQEDISEEEQLNVNRKLSAVIPKLVLHKHSYISLSHQKSSSNEMTENGGRTDKDESSEKEISLAKFDTAENPVSFTGTLSVEALTVPYNFPKGKKIGIALHEVFEKADFEKIGNLPDSNTAQKEQQLLFLIANCFEKQTLAPPKKTPEKWFAYTIGILWNTLNAKFPEIQGNKATGNFFSLKEITYTNRISEAEFNMNAEIFAPKKILNNYCNGFIDLVFMRTFNGQDVYSILDWKSDFFENNEYFYGEELKAHTDEKYSIQRVLYSYSLINWLSIFYPDKTLEQIYNTHFGGIYYVYIRGCKADTGNGIYSRTWGSWQDLENAYKKILKAFHIAY